MPQFDKITFFSQIFWLNITFWGFYFIILSTFLPKVAVVLKTRKKKLVLSLSESTGLNQEHLLVDSNRNKCLSSVSEKSRLCVEEYLSLGTLWKNLFLELFKNNLKDLKSSYYIFSYLILIKKIEFLDNDSL